MMDILSIVLLAIGLSMDAFAVSVTQGLQLKKIQISYALKIGLCFGMFQGVMPCIGWLAGSFFAKYIVSVDHWIAFILLSIIGIKMIYESTSQKEGSKEDEKENDTSKTSNLILLGVATSIDALAVGVNLAFIKADIVITASLIAIITFTISCAGVYLGKAFGALLSKWAEISGGIILIAIGVKILIEHLFM